MPLALGFGLALFQIAKQTFVTQYFSRDINISETEDSVALDFTEGEHCKAVVLCVYFSSLFLHRLCPTLLRSGSMTGYRSVLARLAVRQLLNSLNQNDYFLILAVSFCGSVG